MAHSAPLISTLVFGLVLAFGFGLIAQRLKLPPLIGYLLAGIAIGPFTPGFVADQGVANQLAEIGVILLMFGVGLHFSLDDLLSVRAIAIPGALAQAAVATPLGMAVGWWQGWTPGAGLVFGIALSDGEHRGAVAPACRSAGCSIPSGGASPSAGLSSRTSAWCSCWCCCRRSPACSRAPRMRLIPRSCSRPSPSRSARSPPSSSSCSWSAGR